MRNVKAKTVKATHLLPISQTPITKEKISFFTKLFSGKKEDPNKLNLKDQKILVVDQNVRAFIKKTEKIENRLSKLLRATDKRGLKDKVKNEKMILERLREMLESLKTAYNEYKLNLINKNKLLMEENARKTNELIRNVQTFLGTQVNETLSSVRGV